MHNVSGLLFASTFGRAAFSGYLGEGLHHLLLVTSILFVVIVLASFVVSRGLKAWEQRSS